MQEIDDFKTLIKALGGAMAFSRKMGIPLQMAQRMATSNWITSIYWEEVIEICREEGIDKVDAAWLMHMHARKRGRWRRPPGGYY
jgi:hypothetical protein